MALSPELRKLVSGASNKYSRSSGTRIKPKEGVNRYRILVPDRKNAPWIPANGQFWADLGVHWIKAGENEKPIVVLGCESTVYQRPSRIAPLIDQAINSAIDEESKKLFQSWKAKLSVLVNVLDRSKGSPNPDEPQILELTPTTWGAVMGMIQQYDDEGEDILDAESGMDIIITRTGKGLNTQYSVNVAPGKSQPVPAAALKGCHDLLSHIEKEFFRGEEDKAIAAIGQIAGINVPRIGGPSRGTPTAALTSAASQVEDAEVTEDEDLSVVEELEEEEAPANKKKAETKSEAKPAAAPKPAEVDDDEVDLDDVLGDLENL